MIGLWTQAAIGLLVGLVPGLLLFPWLASPFGPPLWKLSEPLSRVLLTISQFIRGKGVLVKRATGEYEHSTYIEGHPNGPVVQLSDGTVPIDPENLTFGLFGKKPLALTWEPGTELHERMQEGETLADGGENMVNMAAAHRHLRSSNEGQAIDRTKEHSEAKHGGGSDGISERMMIASIMLMLILGFVTVYLTL